MNTLYTPQMSPLGEEYYQDYDYEEDYEIYDFNDGSWFTISLDDEEPSVYDNRDNGMESRTFFDYARLLDDLKYYFTEIYGDTLL